jgi:hypothetical protein
LRIEYKDATLAATKLPKNKPQNKHPETVFQGSFCGTTSDGLKQARSALRICFKPSRWCRYLSLFTTMSTPRTA